MEMQKHVATSDATLRFIICVWPISANFGYRVWRYFETFKPKYLLVMYFILSYYLGNFD
jgi:hypothetical protein